MPSDEEKCSLSSTTFIVCSEEQLVKAYLSISITEFGISMAWSEVQCLKAFFPIGDIDFLQRFAESKSIISDCFHRVGNFDAL